MLKIQEEFGWAKFFFTFFLGSFFVFLTYMIYQEEASNDSQAFRSPIVCMKITARERGAGTVKFPDRIFAEFQGKTYNLSMGRKYFRSLINVDTIAVSFDSASGKAVLPFSGRVRHYAFLFAMIAGLGLVIIGESVRQLVKHINGSKTTSEAG